MSESIRIDRWQVFLPPTEVRRAVFMLPGRGCTCDEMLGIGVGLRLPNTAVVSVETTNYTWYPRPVNSKNQAAAVAGLPEAVEIVRDMVTRVAPAVGAKVEESAVAGFSAGGVVALKAMESIPFLTAVIMSGAALDPKAVRGPANKRGRYLFLHNRRDDVFDWEERYLPMKKAVTAAKIDAVFSERTQFGGHNIYKDDLVTVGGFLREVFA